MTSQGLITDADDCVSCGTQVPMGECPKSPRPCGHHCDHSWTHEVCHWCGATFGEQPPDADRGQS